MQSKNDDHIMETVKCAIDPRDSGIRPLIKEFGELRRQMRATTREISQRIAKDKSIQAFAQQKWMLPLQYDIYLRNARFRATFHRQSVYLEEKDASFFVHFKTKGGVATCYLRVPLKYRPDLEKACGEGFDKNDALGQIEVIEDAKYGWFNAHITLRLPRPKEYTPKGWLGVDTGWNNLATTVYVSNQLNCNEIHNVNFHGSDYRTRIIQIKYLLKQVQRRGKAIKKWRHRLQNVIKYTVGSVAKEIVNKAEKLHAGIAIEKLTFQSHTKQFLIPRYELRCAIKTQCERRGIPFIEVDPKNTSLTCNKCGYVSKASRPRGSQVFKCEKCGYEVNADVNASINIARRGIQLRNERQPKRSRSSKAAVATRQRDSAAGEVVTPLNTMNPTVMKEEV